MNRRGVLTVALLAPAAARAQAQAQASWPNGPVRLIVTFAPGGSADVLARRLAEPVGAAIGQLVVVENRPGAGGNLGIDAVAKAAPDGQTIGLAAAGPLAINPAVPGARMPFDPARDLAPVIHLADQPNVLLAHAGVPADWLAWLRANPEEPFASPGVGTTNHLTGAALNAALGLRLQHVPYRGSGPAHADLLAGRVRLMVDNVATAAPLVRQGGMRALAVSTARRSVALPDVPSLAETSPGFDLPSWQGIVAPARAPAAVLARLNAAFADALRSPALAGFFADTGAAPVGGSPEAFAAFLADQRERWGAIVRALPPGALD